MVYLGTCNVCLGRTHNTHAHAECRVAQLEDALFKIQLAFKAGEEIPTDIKNMIISGNFTTLEKFLEEMKEERELRHQENARQLLRRNVMDEAAGEFDLKNPPKWSPSL